MFRNYLMAALRNLAHNQLYAGITIAGLGLGFTAAILIGLFVRDELSYDRWIPGHAQIYRLDMTQVVPGEKPQKRSLTLTNAAGFLKLDYPGIESVARITPSQSGLRVGALEASDQVMWADRNFFAVLPMPVIAGDLQSALAAPDGLVLTRSMARKYFGKDAPIGETLEINPALDNLPNLSPAQAQALGSFHPMRVLAVLEDLPSNTHLNAEIFAAAEAAFSPMQRWDATTNSVEVYAYVRLRPGASVDDIRHDLKNFAARHYPAGNGRSPTWAFGLTPLAAVHLTPTIAGAMKPAGDIVVVTAIAAIGALIVLIAAINFVTLVTARAARRAVEVGVRKAAGAGRFDLTVQFIGEALIYVALSMLLALMLAELALPYVNAFLRRSFELDYLHDRPLIAGIVATTLVVGVLAGLYPALVLSAFRPTAVLKGRGILSGKSGRVRQALVVIQFAILVSLIVMTATIYRQTQFALHNTLAIHTDHVATIFTPCTESFKQQIGALPNVKTAACTSSMAMSLRPTPTTVRLADGSFRTTQGAAVDPGFLEMHGLRPIAGRFFSYDHPIDVVLQQPSPPADAQPSVVINQRAVQRLGYRTAREALGKTIYWGRYDPSSLSQGGQPPLRASQIIGVTPDFTFASLRSAVEPTVYYVDPKVMLFTMVKLNGHDVQGTLAAIDNLLKRMRPDKPVQRTFENQPLQALYVDVITQGVFIAVCAGLAVFIACLGLFGLAAFSAERRTKEIGIRKAMGAARADIVKLLLWQFSKPVLLANLIAWPVAGFVMSRWLKGFAYHIDLSWWLFVAASMGAATIALLTVCGHSLRVAKAKPVAALRYE